uniref:Uncharacterized protein n=1 Tax=Eutreptiella gymnastica TaxID=73025 RepID=A0A7S4FQE4_9EUGL
MGSLGYNEPKSGNPAVCCVTGVHPINPFGYPLFIGHFFCVSRSDWIHTDISTAPTSTPHVMPLEGRQSNREQSSDLCTSSSVIRRVANHSPKASPLAVVWGPGMSPGALANCPAQHAAW